MRYLLYSSRLFCTILFGFIVSTPLVASAATLGLGPGEIIVDILENEQMEEEFRLTRNDTSTEKTFSVSVSGDASDAIDIMGLESFSMEVGQSSYVIPFVIDASGYELGSHEAVIEIVMEPDVDSSNLVDVRIAMSGRVTFNVVTQLKDEDNAVSVNDDTSLLNNIIVSDLSAQYKKEEKSYFITGQWSLQNSSAIPLTDIPYSIDITRNGQLFSRNTGVFTDVLSPGEQSYMQYGYIFSHDPGDYEVTLQVGDIVETKTFSIYNRILIFEWIVLIIVGLSSAGLLFYYFSQNRGSINHAKIS